MLSCAIVLNPRYKLDLVDYTFKTIEPIEHIVEMNVERLQIQLYKHFTKYECPNPMAITNVSSCVGSSSRRNMDDHDEDMEDDVSKLHFL